MFRRMWQSAMIGLARSKRVKSFMQGARATSFLRDRYVAGVEPEAGVARASRLLRDENIRSSLFYMGEYVDDFRLVEQNVSQKLAVVAALARSNLDIHVSVDPTQIGHHVEPGIVKGNAERIAQAIRSEMTERDGVHCMMFDMEDASLNDPTIALHDVLQDDGYPVALTLQAYLHRTYGDLARQVQRGSKVRLVKGAFAAGPEIAFQAQADIKNNSRRLISLMLSPEARQAGFYPIIATMIHGCTISRPRPRRQMAGRRASTNLKCCSVCAKTCRLAWHNVGNGSVFMSHSAVIGGRMQ